MPIQKLGSETPASATSMHRVSIQLFGLSPAVMPRRRPTDQSDHEPAGGELQRRSAPARAIIRVTGWRER